MPLLRLPVRGWGNVLWGAAAQFRARTDSVSPCALVGELGIQLSSDESVLIVAFRRVPRRHGYLLITDQPFAFVEHQAARSYLRCSSAQSGRWSSCGRSEDASAAPACVALTTTSSCTCCGPVSPRKSKSVGSRSTGVVEPPFPVPPVHRSKLRFVAAPLSFDPILEARHQWDEHWGDGATPSMAAVTSIMRAQQIMTARLNGLLEPLDLTFARYEALMLLLHSRSGALPLGKIRPPSGAPRQRENVIDRLADRGYVERVNHERDRRAILARITREGKRVARQATKRLNAAEFGTAPLGVAACEEIFALLHPLRVAASDFVNTAPPA